MGEVNGAATKRSEGSVQSIGRAFAVLEALVDRGGVAGVSELAKAVDLPVPTIHRLLRTLATLGYVSQEPSRDYTLGPRLVQLGDAASRLLERWVRPYLEPLAQQLGESVNFAVLDGAEVVYLAQVPGRHSMRMFTEVGHRAGVHSTAVGKAILSTLPPEQVQSIIERIQLDVHTSRTLTSVPQLMRELDAIRAQGFATDLGEQEMGVCCVAVPLPGNPARGAVSISFPASRMTTDAVGRSVTMLNHTAVNIARALDNRRVESHETARSR